MHNCIWVPLFEGWAQGLFWLPRPIQQAFLNFSRDLENALMNVDDAI